MARGHSMATAAAVAAAAFLLLVGQTSASAGHRSDLEANNLILAVERGRQMMQFGYPQYGIIPLDPWVIPRCDGQLVNSAMNLKVEARGIRVSNTHHFVLNSLKSYVRPRKTRVDFTVTLPSLTITADHYKIKGSLTGLIPLQGKGDLNVVLKNVRAVGTVTLDTTRSVPVISNLNIKRLSAASIKAKLGGASSLVNSIITQQGPALINEVRDEVSDFLKEQLVPVVNEYTRVLWRNSEK